MNEEFAPDMALSEASEETGQLATVDNPALEATFDKYLGRWNLLVSTTNWEKGRIVAEWREALIEAGAPASIYSDEAWSRRVGSVTPQHTGRLRRVYQRFGPIRAEYAGLYWSHFQAALDWDDAEMWLEGAVQNRWSIAQMQGERSRTLGALVEESVEAVAVEVDEDSAAVPAGLPPSDSATMIDTAEAADTSSDEAFHDGEPCDAADSFAGDDDAEQVAAPFRPFENLPSLPADLREALDTFKVAVIHHRISNWQEVSRDDVLATLDALRQLVLAPG
jgi:hypothetical protein